VAPRSGEAEERQSWRTAAAYEGGEDHDDYGAAAAVAGERRLPMGRLWPH
jgi:hypothetical protein